MGCSVCKKKVSEQSLPPRKVSLFKNSTAKLFNMVRVGHKVAINPNNTVLILVFGGPSSKKGRIVNEIINTYNFKLIRVEDLLLKYLATSTYIEDRHDGINEIKGYVTDNPGVLQLSSILKLLKKEISKDFGSKYLIELIPNFKCFITNEAFMKDPTNELQNFEHNFPICFAMDFSSEIKQMVVNLNTAVNEVLLTKNTSLSQDMTDEADEKRTKTRAIWYEKTAYPYIVYFQKSQRLVSIDTSSFTISLIWTRLCHLFSDFKIPCKDNDDIKVLFTFDKQKLTRSMRRTYGLFDVPIHNALKTDLDAPPETVLEKTCKLINKFDSSMKYFYVNLEGTSVRQGAHIPHMNDSIVFFIGPSDAKLSEILEVYHSCPMMNVLMLATPESVNCIFPEGTDLKLCKDITMFMSDCRMYS